MAIDATKLGTLVADKKYDEMKGYISEALKEPMTEEQKGRELINLSVVYMDVMTTVNNACKDLLADAITAVESVKAAEGRIGSMIQLKEVRANLA